MESNGGIDSLMDRLGQFGRYQATQFFLHILSAGCAGIHMLSLVTVAAVPEHRCAVPGMQNDSYGALAEDVLAEWVPFQPSGKVDPCHILVNGTVELCTKWVYDPTYYRTSRVIDWELVCDRRWMRAVAQSTFMLGVLMGAVILGGIADKVGRKPVFCYSATAALALGVGCAFIENFWVFVFAKFFLGAAGSAGSYITGFVLTMELVGPKFRTACGVAFQAAFAGGIMLVAGWGALIADRRMLQLVYGLHGIILLFHWFAMDESPRWLWANEKHSEALRILKKALKMNNLNTDDLASTSSGLMGSDKGAAPSEPARVTDLFRSPNLRRNTLNVAFCWFANSLVYYGLSLNTGQLQGNPYFVLCLTGAVELPSYVITIIVMDRWGRRPLVAIGLLVGGACCIAGIDSSLSTTASMLGKFFVASSFAVIYNYSAELFPTVVRNSAMGLGSMAARTSGTLTPLVSLLDSLNPAIPAIIFGVVAILSGTLTLFLPETMGRPMPQTIRDGERFGRGDNCFRSFCPRRSVHEAKGTPAQLQPLKSATE